MTFELRTFNLGIELSNSNYLCNYRTCIDMFDNIINLSYTKYRGNKTKNNININ